MSKASTFRIWLCISLVIAIIIGFDIKITQARRFLGYKTGKERLELNLKKDERFHNVRVFFYPTRPSVFIAAPTDFSLSTKKDLEHLVNDAFGSLPVPIYYKDTIAQTNSN